MEQTEEILKAIEQTNDGVWLPIATLTVVFGVVVSLLLYIWKQSQKTNDKRHTDNEKMIKGMSKTLQTMSLLLVKIETNQDNQQRELNTLLK
jgi:hypothetical protein